jgi:hypothetical protein
MPGICADLARYGKDTEEDRSVWHLCARSESGYERVDWRAVIQPDLYNILSRR